MGICWFNGELVAAKQAAVSVYDHGLLYGDGVFEGIRFYNGQPFRLAAHLARLFDSAAAIGLVVPYSDQALTNAVYETISAYRRPQGYLRLVVTRGVGALGINPAGCRAGVFMIADELVFSDASVRERGARVVIAATRRLPADGLDPRIKSLNYLNHILARMEAGNAGADEAILLNQQGRVTEGTTDNVFIVKSGVLMTPPVTDGALDGITRNMVLALAHELGITARETSLAPFDLYTADECFLTGTAAELIPVREVDGRGYAVSPGPVFRRLNAAFADAIDRETRRKEIAGL